MLAVVLPGNDSTRYHRDPRPIHPQNHAHRSCPHPRFVGVRLRLVATRTYSGPRAARYHGVTATWAISAGSTYSQGTPALAQTATRGRTTSTYRVSQLGLARRLPSPYQPYYTRLDRRRGVPIFPTTPSKCQRRNALGAIYQRPPFGSSCIWDPGRNRYYPSLIRRQGALNWRPVRRGPSISTTSQSSSQYQPESKCPGLSLPCRPIYSAGPHNLSHRGTRPSMLGSRLLDVEESQSPFVLPARLECIHQAARDSRSL